MKWGKKLKVCLFQVIPPMGGAVASMISSVVNQSAITAHATATGGKGEPPRSTFGKRNIKNQVNFTKFHDHLLIVVFAQ